LAELAVQERDPPLVQPQFRLEAAGRDGQLVV